MKTKIENPQADPAQAPFTPVSFNDLEDFESNIDIQEESQKKAAYAADEARKFTLGGTTVKVLDQAVAMIIKRKTQARPVNIDPRVSARSSFHAELLEAVGGNIMVAVKSIMEAPTEDDLLNRDQRPARVFSFLFDVMKAAMFVTNGRFRVWINGQNRDDSPLFARRDTTREPPYGLAFEEDANVDAELADSIEDLKAWFFVLTSMVEFDLPEADFPIAYELQPDQTFAPVYNVLKGWDLVEKRSQESRSRRAANDAKARSEAIQRAFANMKDYAGKPKDAVEG